MTETPERSTVLFLQGPPSLFWRELAEAFEAAGSKVLRINLSAADWLYWRKSGAVNYRGSLGDWPAYIRRVLVDNGVTDVLYYADRLPYHAVAAEIAESLGVRATSIEFGYLRPDWLTVERGGAGARCHFPEDPETIRRIAAAVPEVELDVRYSHSFRHEAFNEVFYNLVAYFGRPFFPRYAADKYYNPLLDYLSWLPRFVRERLPTPDPDAIVEAWREAGTPYWVLAMQLQADYQIRANSPYRHLSTLIDEVVGSFARHAPAGGRLLVKTHPLDNGLERWPRVVAETALRHGVADRVTTVSGGQLGRILRGSEGVVVANSTVGLHAIRAGRPTKVLGIAMFDVPGLTHQGPLEGFWSSPEPVDDSLAGDFVKAIAATIQVKGSFYNREGRAKAVGEIVQRVRAGAVNEPGAFAPVPPRLARARRMGIPSAESAVPR
jgi:capsular polysaccharide export protein